MSISTFQVERFSRSFPHNNKDLVLLENYQEVAAEPYEVTIINIEW